MAILKSYLTSLEPNMDQIICSQSIGGYCSNSLLYPETNLSSTIGLYDTSISLDIPSSGDWSEWQGVEYINIGNEIIQVSPMTNGTVTVIKRGYNGIINMHIAGDEVRSSFSRQLFNNVFNDDYKQYRCIAIKNDSLLYSNPSDERIAYNFSIYLKQNSRNNDSLIKVSLEQSNSQYITSSSTIWNTMQIVDTSLIGLYDDNYFKDAYLKILSGGANGQGKIINSFDSTTGAFTFYNSFSSTYDYNTNVTYEVLPSPSQRIKTGTVASDTSGTSVSSFVETSKDASLHFTSGNISNPIISDLFVNDVVYVWLERTIEKGIESFNNNDIVLNINYTVSE